MVTSVGPRSHRGTDPYAPPSRVEQTTLGALLAGVRIVPENQQIRFGIAEGRAAPLWYSGDPTLVQRRCVAVVGTRSVSDEGARRAQRIARELVAAGVVVVSGLAEGVDTFALETAVEKGGHVIAVIGTPLDRSFPIANRRLQERIYRHHLLISQFADGTAVRKGNFPARNKVMAAVSDATVIIEASDSSGTLHQASECVRLGRPLFIAKSIADDPRLKWPGEFLRKRVTRILTSVEDVLAALPSRP